MKDQIKQMLSENFIISDENKEKLLSSLEDLEGEKLEKMFGLVQKADEKQDEMMQSSFEKNPALFAKVKQIVQHELMAEMKEVEDASREEEKHILDELEDEILNIFAS